MIVIFDLDGTLTQKDTYLSFLGRCVKELKIRNTSLLSLPFHTLLFYLKIISNHDLKEHFLRTILSGVPVKKIEPIADRFISRLMQSGINKTILSRLYQYQQDGHSVILATASFDFYVSKLAQKLAISQVICTRAEIKNGRLTGRILGRNCHGTEKINRLEDLFSRHDWENTIVYSDHYSDFPLLIKGSKSYLVKPNALTRFKLRKYNFPVID